MLAGMPGLLADRWNWDTQLPEVAWQAEIGAGFSGVAVSDGRVVAFGNENDEDRVTCLEAATGRVLWTYRYPSRALGIAKPDEAGPRVTPLAHGGAVYTLSRHGLLLCLEETDGRLRWWLDVAREIGEPPPYWGFSGSPLVWGDLLIWPVGAHGLALRAATGEMVWKSDPRPSEVWKNVPVGVSGYISPQIVERAGRQRVGLASENRWWLVDPATGKPEWSTPWEVPYGVTAAQPAMTGQGVLLSGGYGYGLRLVELDGEGEPRWHTKNLRSHFAPLAVVAGFVYGIDGNQQDGARCELRCLRLDTGEARWARERFGFANLTLAEGRLLILTARGELVLVQPDPERYRELGRVQVLGGESWTAPQVHGPAVYVRNKQGTLARVNLPGAGR